MVAGDKKLNEGAANVVRGHGGSVGSLLSAEPGQIPAPAFKPERHRPNQRSMPRLRQFPHLPVDPARCRAPPRRRPGLDSSQAAFSSAPTTTRCTSTAGVATITDRARRRQPGGARRLHRRRPGHPCGGQDCTATPPDNGVGVNHTPAGLPRHQAASSTSPPGADERELQRPGRRPPLRNHRQDRVGRHLRRLAARAPPGATTPS